MDWQITGHKRQLEFLQHALETGSLPHGLLFAGPAGVGKHSIALKLASHLLGQEIREMNPDLLIVERLPDKREIVIEQIRDLVYKLSLKPYSAPYKVAIIDDAAELTDEAANALLKSLEEPKDYTVIVLITSNPSRLPKTIISRTQKINFGLVEGREPQPQPEDRSEEFLSKDMTGRLILAQELADLETEEIRAVLKSWLIRLSNALRINPSKDTKNRIERVADSLRFLEQNVNTKLLLTNLMLETQ